MLIMLTGIISGYCVAVNRISMRATRKTTEILRSLDMDERFTL